MSALSLFLLGSPRIECDGLPVRIGRRKAVAVLVYLALTDGNRSRDSLAGMFWPEFPRNRALANLRQTITTIKNAIGEANLQADREQVWLVRDGAPWVDVDRFRSLIAECATHTHGEYGLCADCLSRMGEAVGLYTDHFLAGFGVRDSPEFDDWQFFQEESLRRELSGALAGLADGLAAQERYGDAIEQARRLLALDPLAEESHRMLMQLYSWDGQYAAALRQYDRCVQMLDEELGVTPAGETTEVYQRVKGGREDHRKPAPTRKTSTTASVGREEVRVLTIVVCGPGGDADSPLVPAEDGVHDLTGLAEGAFSGRGALVHTQQGGDVVGVFGHDRSHEDDAERAVSAALDLRTAAGESDIDLTTGIDTGPVYVRVTEDFHGPLVTGPIVQQALRLRYRARENEILVTEGTYRRTRRAFRFDSLSLKEGHSPASIHKVLGRRDRPQRSQGIEGLRADLVGREHQLAVLEAAFVDLMTGAGRMVSLVGEAGVGKSRLIAELRIARGGEDGAHLWLEGRCQPMGMTTAYWPFLDVLRTCFDFHLGETGNERVEKLRSYLRATVDQEALSEDASEELGHALGRLLGIEAAPVDADPQQTQHESFKAIRSFLITVSRITPVVLVVEDLHWADSLSLDLLNMLAKTVLDTRLLILCVHRPDENQACRLLTQAVSRKLRDRYTEIVLGDLTDAQSQALVSSLLPENTLSEQTKNMITVSSEGNPFFLEEIIRSLIDGEKIVSRDGVWREQGEVESVTASTNVLALIQGRVDRLNPELRRVLIAASVIGSTFDEEVLAEMGPFKWDLGVVLTELQVAGFLFAETIVPERTCAFRHILVREAIYQTIPPDAKAMLHNQAGHAMETVYADRLPEHYERLAFYFDRGKDEEKAIAYLVRAGEKAYASCHHLETIVFFQRVLDRTEADIISDARLRALTGMGHSFLNRDKTRAEQLLRRALALARQMDLPPRRMAQVLYLVGDLRWGEDRRHEKTLLGREGLTLLEGDDESVEKALMICLIAGGYEALRQYRHAWDTIRGAAELLDRLPYSHILNGSYFMLGNAYTHNKQPEKALSLYQSVRKQAEAQQDPRGLWFANRWIGRVHRQIGDYQSVPQWEERGLAATQRSGHPIARLNSQRGLGEIYLCLGNLAQAEEFARATLETLGSAENESSRGMIHQALGTIALCRGETEAAVEHFQRAASIFGALSVPYDAGLDLVPLARGFEAQGKRAEAAALFRKAVILDVPDIRFSLLQNAWGGLEEALDEPQVFRDLCDEMGATGETVVPFCLEPTALDAIPEIPVNPVEWHETLSDDWTWEDPYTDCGYSIQGDIEIHAVNGRDFCHVNYSAPRIMKQIEGSFAFQARCCSATDDKPAMGGILLWSSRENYLVLQSGRFGKHQVWFGGSLENRDLAIGQGRLFGNSVLLRLEHRGGTVHAYCSADGSRWYTVGDAPFPGGHPVRIGIHAVGEIDRTIHPGAYPGGTAMRFTDLALGAIG